MKRRKMGTIVKRVQGCDYFIIEVDGDYVVVEWFSGHDPEEGDQLIGSFEHYGHHDFEVVGRNLKTRLWIEDFWLNRERATEVYQEKCKLG